MAGCLGTPHLAELQRPKLGGGIHLLGDPQCLAVADATSDVQGKCLTDAESAPVPRGVRDSARQFFAEHWEGLARLIERP
jgi:hypothetical protein